jgi:two-component system, sensor histidine kinase YesM
MGKSIRQSSRSVLYYYLGLLAVTYSEAEGPNPSGFMEIDNMLGRLKDLVIQFPNNIKFRTKLMFSYSIFILIPLGLLTFISSNQVSKTIENLVLYSAKQNFEQTCSFLDYKIGKIIDTTDVIPVDRNLISILTKPIENYSYSEQLRDAQDLNTLYLTKYQDEVDLYRLRLYVRDEVIYSQEHVNLFGMSDIKDTKWYKLLTTRKDKIIWCPPNYFVGESEENNSIVSAARTIRDPNFYNKIIGIFRIDLLEDNLKSIVKKANITQKGVAYLQNSEGAIVTSSDYNIMKTMEVDQAYSLSLSKEESFWGETIQNGSRLLVGSRNIQGTDWILVSVIPYEEILSSSITIRNQMLLLMLLLITLAYVFAYYISGSNTKRISRLIKKMRKAQEGDLELISVTPGSDEIGELMKNFNFMIQKIKILIEDQYKSGQEIKSAELKALQAQINPHFLYNTLDLINWTAIKYNVPEISSMVKSLSRFYKLSLSKGRDVVPISDELEHVKLYVDIQNRRFENKIHLQIKIDDSILDCSVLKIILQPIVENSILHGILEREDKSGNITIIGRLEQDTVIMSVCDDGVGMDEETIIDILNSKSEENHGYGVWNINNRLKLYYGEEYGLIFKSETGKGTEAEIRIPAVSIRDIRDI